MGPGTPSSAWPSVCPAPLPSYRQPRRVGAASPGTYQWVRSLQSSATSWRFTLLVFELHIVGSLTRACSLQPLLFLNDVLAGAVERLSRDLAPVNR
jgi:hypothetical protein